jgi:hypothetical protein
MVACTANTLQNCLVRGQGAGPWIGGTSGINSALGLSVASERMAIMGMASIKRVLTWAPRLAMPSVLFAAPLDAILAPKNRPAWSIDVREADKFFANGQFTLAPLMMASTSVIDVTPIILSGLCVKLRHRTIK